jgi:hypothetical protein
MAKAKFQGKASIFAVQRNYEYEQKAREDAGIDRETIDEWKQRVIDEWSIPTLQTYSVNFLASTLAFHARCVLDDGNPKPFHAHAVIQMDSHSGITQEQAKAIFHCSCDENCQKVNAKTKKHVAGAYQYLLHETQQAIAEKKSRYYDYELIISLAPEIEAKYKTCRRGILEFYYEMSAGNINVVDTPKQDRQAEAINDYRNAVLSGQITADDAYEMIRTDRACLDFDISTALKEEDKFARLERRYIHNVQKYCTGRNTKWCKTSIYISGSGNSGKSNLADAFAMRHSDARGFHRVSAKGKDITFDLADGYSMERVSVINEVQGDSFAVPQFLSVFDPKRAEKAGSRNEDSFYAPEYVLFTNSTSVEQFVFDLCRDTLAKSANAYSGGDYDKYIMSLESSRDANKILQVRRRFAINCEIKNGYLGVFYRIDREPAYEHRLYTNKSYEIGHECFVLFGSMPFNSDDEKCLNDAINMIDDAIAEYYMVNDYSVNPLNSGWTWATQNHVFGDVVELPNASDETVSIRPDADGRKIQVRETGYECTTDEFSQNIDNMFDLVETIGNIMSQKIQRSATYGTADRFGVYSGVHFAKTVDGYFKIQYSFYDSDIHKFVDTDLYTVIPDGTIEMLRNMGYDVFNGKNKWCAHFISYMNKMFFRSDVVSFYYRQHMQRFMQIRDVMRANGLWIEREKDKQERERLEQINAKIDASGFHAMTGNI